MLSFRLSTMNFWPLITLVSKPLTPIVRGSSRERPSFWRIFDDKDKEPSEREDLNIPLELQTKTCVAVQGEEMKRVLRFLCNFFLLLRNKHVPNRILSIGHVRRRTSRSFGKNWYLISSQLSCRQLAWFFRSSNAWKIWMGLTGQNSRFFRWS